MGKSGSTEPLKDLWARGSTPQKTNRPHRSCFAMENPLSPLASLCLGVVRGWINVARNGRGGQVDDKGTAWTRLPANQLRDQLSREFLVEVSTRSIQRALKELEETNRVRREQKWKHRYKRDYWYALPTYEEALDAHRPRTIAGNYKSSRKNPSVPVETTGTTQQVLPTQNYKTQFFRDANQKPKTERKDSITIAVETCMAKGNAGKGFGREITRRSEPTPTRGKDHKGREIKECWVNGRMHLVID